MIKISTRKDVANNVVVATQRTMEDEVICEIGTLQLDVAHSNPKIFETWLKCLEQICGIIVKMTTGTDPVRYERFKRSDMQ